MVMAEKEGVEQKEMMVSGPKSPWKKPFIRDAPVMGAADSWPALADAQHQNRPKNADASATLVASDPPLVEGAVGQQKSHGSGNSNTSLKSLSACNQKSGSKHYTNAASPFPVLFSYHQPSMSAIFHAMVPPPHLAVPGYGYPTYPGPFTIDDNQTPLPAFVPPVHTVDAGRTVQPSPRGDPNAPVANFSNRRPNIQEPGGPMNHAWHHKRAFGPRERIPVQQGIGPQPLVRPAFFGPAPGPGYMVGPSFPGAAVCYVPVAPPGSIRGRPPPCFFPYPVNPGPPVLPLELRALKDNIVKQIEYYFSDENLRNDHYLISLMDGQGWVPILTIADFKRVKRMSTDIPFILYALQSSSTVEVQGDMVRRRDEWSKWIPASAEHLVSSTAQTTQSESLEHAVDSSGKGGTNEAHTKEMFDENVGFSSNAGNLFEDVLPNIDCLEVTHSNDKDHCSEFVLPDSGKQAFSDENGDSRSSISESDRGTHHSTLCKDQSQEVESARFGDYVAQSVELSSKVAVKNLNDVSNDFASTFMLDEELEIEQKTMKKDDFPAARRLDDEDDENVVNDQDVERLVIVTQPLIER